MRDIIIIFMNIIGILSIVIIFLQTIKKITRTKKETKITFSDMEIIMRNSGFELVQSKHYTDFLPPKKDYVFFNNIITLFDKIEKKRRSIIDKICNKKKQNSIIDEIYNKKKKQLNIALLLVSVSAVFYYSTNLIFYSDIKIEVLIILFVLFIFIVISRFLVSYRIKKGYYGTNFEECKELIYYLIDDKDKNNKNKGKKIFNEIDGYNEAGELNTTVVGELEY